jgi:glycosyltransferase involved in cell wall biosynthesis
VGPIRPPTRTHLRGALARAGGRVLIIVQNLPVPLDRRVWLECQALRSVGRQVSVICPMGPGDPAYQLLDGVHLHKYPPPPASSGLLSFAWEFIYCWLRSALLTVRVARREGFDVMQACNPPDTYWALGAIVKLFGKIFVYDQHDLCPELFESRFGGRGSRLLLRCLRLLERLTYRTADHVISTNESYRAIAIGRGGRSLTNTTVVRSGPGDSLLEPLPPEPSLRRGRRHLVCYLGIMGPQDGVDLLLEVVRHYVRDLDRHDTHFALLGFGDCLEDLRARALELGVDGYVEFTGRADTNMIRRYFSTADVGVQPDPKTPLNDVSTHNKTMEYMALGLPVVAFDLKETRVTAGNAALFVENDDTAAMAEAIARLLDDPQRRGEMGVLGRSLVVERLAWRHQARRYLSVYDRFFNEPASEVSAAVGA